MELLQQFLMKFENFMVFLVPPFTVNYLIILKHIGALNL